MAFCRWIIGISLLCCLFGCKKDEDPTSTAPVNLPQMPTARHHLGFVECKGLLYAVGGYNADGMKTVEAYDPKTNTWTTKASMSNGRGWLVVAVVSDKIYAIGGITGGSLDGISYLTANEMYDPTSDTWTLKAPIPMNEPAFNSVLGNQFMAGASVNGKIYVVAGDSDAEVPTFIYDPVTNTWDSDGKSIAKFSNSPYSTCGTSNSLFVLETSYFLKYSPSTDEWFSLSVLSTPRQEASLSSLDGKIYSAGGLNITNSMPTIWESTGSVDRYDPSSNSWTNIGQLVEKRYSLASLIFEGKLYAVGGVKYDAPLVPLNSFEAITLN